MRLPVFLNVPNLYFSVGTAGDQVLPAFRDIQPDSLIGIRFAGETEQRPSRHPEIPTNQLFILARAAVQPRPAMRELHRRNAAFVALKLMQVPKRTIRLRHQLYRVLPSTNCNDARLRHAGSNTTGLVRDWILGVLTPWATRREDLHVLLIAAENALTVRAELNTQRSL